MFDELLQRLTPRLTKQTINLRESLEPGLKVALTIRHLASGSRYSDMQHGWRVPANSISIVVREVCSAIIEEYVDEQMTLPTTEEGWKQVADDWYKTWIFLHIIGAVDGKHVAFRCPPSSALNTTTTRASSPSSCLLWCHQTTSSCG